MIQVPEKTVKRRLQDCDAALASDDGPIFSTVANLIEALKHSFPEGTENAERICLRTWSVVIPQVGARKDR